MAVKDNFQRPQGLVGRLMLTAMNIGHSPMAKWAFKQFTLPHKADIADLGCGGGANIRRLLEACPEGKVFGVDLSEESVRKSKLVNKKYMGTRCKVIQGNVAALPFKTASLDIATAFETVYFWQDIENCFREVRRILKPGGRFIVVNDAGDPNQDWTDRIPGMTDYRPGDVKALMKEAGFENISITSENFKYCVIGCVPYGGEL